MIPAREEERVERKGRSERDGRCLDLCFSVAKGVHDALIVRATAQPKDPWTAKVCGVWAHSTPKRQNKSERCIRRFILQRRVKEQRLAKKHTDIHTLTLTHARAHAQKVRKKGSQGKKSELKNGKIFS